MIKMDLCEMVKDGQCEGEGVKEPVRVKVKNSTRMPARLEEGNWKMKRRH